MGAALSVTVPVDLRVVPASCPVEDLVTVLSLAEPDDLRVVVVPVAAFSRVACDAVLLS